MEQNANKSAMQNGLIAGALISVSFLISASKIPVLSSLTIFISIAIVVFLYIATKRFRDTNHESAFSFGQAYAYIFRVYLYGSLIGSLVMLVYATINPNFLSLMLNDTMMLYDKMNIPVDESVSDVLEMLLKPAPYALVNLLGKCIVGVFWGLVLAAFLKKKKVFLNNNARKS